MPDNVIRPAAFHADAPSDTEVRFDNVKPASRSEDPFWRFVDQWLETNDGGDDAA